MNHDAGYILKEYFGYVLRDYYIPIKNYTNSNHAETRDEVLLPRTLVRDNVITDYEFYYTFASDNINRMYFVKQLNYLCSDVKIKFYIDDNVYLIRMWLIDESLDPVTDLDGTTSTVSSRIVITKINK